MFAMRVAEEDTSRGGDWVSSTSLTLLRNETLPLLSSQSQGREVVQKNKKKTSWKGREMPSKLWTRMLKKPAGVTAVSWC